MMVKKKLFGMLVLGLVVFSLLVPLATAKTSNIKFDKLKDANVIGEASAKLSKTLAKDLIQVEKGYGSTTNATVELVDGKLTIILQDDQNHDGRWFRISKKVLDKFDINIDSNIINVYVDGKKTQSQKVEADKDKWIYFYVEHFSTRVITFEASIGYVEYENSVLMNYIEVPDDTGLYEMRFDGIDDYVIVDDANDTLAPDTLTVVIWVKDYRHDPNNLGLIAKGNPSGINPPYSWYLGYFTAKSDTFGFALMSGGSAYSASFNVPSFDGMLVCVADGSQLKVYANGTLMATGSYPGTIDKYNFPLLIGMVYNQYWINVDVYRVMIYNLALSDEEIQQIYNDPDNPPLDGLVLWFAPDSVDTVNNKWLDKSGNGNDGMINGATPVPIAKPVISNVAFDGQNFNITVTTEPASSFVDHVIVPKDLTPPSNINLIAFFYNNELYITGKSDQFPVMANIQHLPKGIYYASNGEIIHQQISTTETVLIVGNITSPSGVVKKYNDFTVSPTSNYVNITVLSKSKTLISLNASAPANTSVDFVWWPSFSTLFRPVQFIVDGKIIQEKTFKNNVVNFTYSGWSDHTIMMQPKPYTEVSNQYATLAISGLIGIVILGIALEQTKVENEWVRAGLIGLAVALFVMLVLTLL